MACDCHTLAGRVLAKVLRLVPSKETSPLGFGCGATREFLVEVDDSTHAGAVRICPNGLKRELSALNGFQVELSRPIRWLSQLHVHCDALPNSVGQHALHR